MGSVLARMIDIQRHRGPDGEGSWQGRIGYHSVGLSHVRLAIIDLTEAGQQPMFSPDRKHAIVYNGEIYNYLELRAELEGMGVRFRTSSDTEVVLWALMTWGEQAPARFNGMWALAWTDLSSEKLMLSRDRFGVKPLYLHRGRDGLFFASEIKALLAGTGGRFAINTEAAGRFIQQSLLDVSSETFFSGIEALPAGHNLLLDLQDRAALNRPEAKRYWFPPAQDETIDYPLAKRIQAVGDLFEDAVRIRLRSDVPVGVLLSGGVDSSSIASVMRRVLGSGGDVHAISAVSDNSDFDEAPYITEMERYLGRESPAARRQKDLRPHSPSPQLVIKRSRSDRAVGIQLRLCRRLRWQ